MHRRSALWMLMMAAALLAACVQLPAGKEAEPQQIPPPEKEVAVPVVVEVPQPDDIRQLAELVTYGLRVAHMNADDQKREYAGANQAYGRDKTVYTRVKLALLLSLPGTAVADEARALALLEPYANSTANTGILRQFGALLHANLAERAKSQRRADQLKDQLEALRAVERSIIERGLESQPRKP